MTHLDKLNLLAEKKHLEDLLSDLPETAKITKMSLKSKLENIEGQLKFQTMPDQAASKVRLTFNGGPVVGSHGIFAEFGMRAVNGFADAVVLMAASLFAPLALRGPISNRDSHQLLITNTAIGSFGFELEEHLTENSLIDEISPISIALERTQNLLFGSIGSDDLLAESASETDPRVLEKVRSFLQILLDSDAICEMQFEGRSFKFSDLNQVRSSIGRLGQDNIIEKDEILEGSLQGILPKSRTFEFLFTNAEGKPEIIKGRISSKIKNPSELNSKINTVQKTKFNVTKVGSGKPKYSLLELL